MTYEEAREYIESSRQFGSRPGLDTITELLNRIGNPQEQLKVIHIAGTNGKGSTAAYIAAILSEQGFKVGRYNSPAVFSYREIIQISKKAPEVITPEGMSPGGIIPEERIYAGITSAGITSAGKTSAGIISERITPEEITPEGIASERIVSEEITSEYITEAGISETISIIQQACADMVREGYPHPTSFEIETAMAFLYLYGEKVDFAVIEAGMGGRLDATNVITQPVCSVITSISMDHMQYLGDSLSKIAGEKAGIIKRGTPVITGNSNPGVIEVLEKTCREKETALIFALRDTVTDINYSPEGTSFIYMGEEYVIGLLGDYQISNAVIAVRAVEAIRKAGYTISTSAVKKGLQSARWRGRFEVLSKEPYFIIDGAHNEDAALELKKTVEIYFPGQKLIYILGVLADKDYRRILEITAPLAKLIITITPPNSRALASGQLAAEAEEFCSGTVIDAVTVPGAVTCAYDKAGIEDVIIAFGSLSFLSEVTGLLIKS